MIVIESYCVINMADTMLVDYELYTSEQAALKAYPSAIVASEYLSDLLLEQRIDKELRRFDIAYSTTHMEAITLLNQLSEFNALH